MSTVFIGTYQAIRISLQEQYYSSATLRSVLSSSPRYISLHPHKFLSNNYASFAFGRSQYAPRPAVLLKCPSNRMKWIQTTPSPCSRRSAHPPQTWRGKGKPGGSRSRNTTTSLSRNQFISLFGNSMTRQDGKHLLATLQDHRCKGTLDAKIDFPEKSIAAGLRYLRARYPVDEDAAINARVDKELENEFRLPQANTEQSPYAHSSLEKIRKENQERNEREMASREKQDIPNSSKGTAVATKPRTLRNLVQRSNEVPDWVQKYRVKAQSTEMPEISTLARLFPTGVFTVSIVILSVLFALNYTPPSQQARMFPETPPAAATLLAILGINISVFVLWRIPQMWAFMNKYFICLPLQPRPAQMLFTGFSHQEIPHLVVNMVPMWFVGVRCRFTVLAPYPPNEHCVHCINILLVHDDIGRGSFLALLLAGAVLNSYTTMSTYVLSNILSSSFIGASGIVTCMIGAACVLHEG